MPVFTGHLQTWFGGSFNRSDFVSHDTINFSGTAADGTTFSIHLVDHLSTTPNVAAAPNSFDIGQCRLPRPDSRRLCADLTAAGQPRHPCG